MDDSHQHPANQAIHDNATLGQRVADKMTQGFGSWRYLITQTAVVAAWVVLNLVAFSKHWDPYPFILLNLAFSLQGSYAAPLMLLSQNRQSEHDRLRAEQDFAVNQAALELLTQIHSGQVRICHSGKGDGPNNTDAP